MDCLVEFLLDVPLDFQPDIGVFPARTKIMFILWKANWEDSFGQVNFARLHVVSWHFHNSWTKIIGLGEFAVLDRRGKNTWLIQCHALVAYTLSNEVWKKHLPAKCDMIFWGPRTSFQYFVKTITNYDNWKIVQFLIAFFLWI